MAQKIIAFISPLRAGAEQLDYCCPDSSVVSGVQTNEAPLRYLLRRYPNAGELLCIVTPDATSAFDHLQEMLKREWPGVHLRKIPYHEAEVEFSDAPLSELLQAMRSGDEILLETTGGFRNAMMYLLLISRAMTYIGVRTAGAVYSNFQSKIIEDISGLIGKFELIGGMQELASFGSVRTLRQYYGESPNDPLIAALLASIEQLWESITLCRIKDLKHQVEGFREALRETQNCSDPLMCALLPAFRAKFDEKLGTITLIKWCVESDMLQQALTVYTEHIPNYIFKRSKLLQISGAKWISSRPYEDEDAVQFYRGFLQIATPKQENSFRMDDAIKTIKDMEKLWPNSGYSLNCSVEKMQVVARDYLYIKALRNKTNHASGKETADQERLMTYLKDYGYVPFDQVGLKDVRQAILAGLEHLRTGKGAKT